MPNGPLESRAFKVSAITGISSILSIIFQIISVPICLRNWGAAGYGNWLSLYSAFLIIRSLDGGYVTYVGNRINISYNVDLDGFRRHLASAIFGIAIISVIQIALVTGAYFADPLAKLLGLSVAAGADGADRLGLLVLVGCWVLTGSYLAIVHRMLIPAGLMYQAAWWSMAFQISNFTALIVAACLKLDLFQTSLVFALSQSTIYLASALYIRSRLPGFYPWWRSAHLRTGVGDLRNSTIFVGATVIQQGVVNGVILMIAALGGGMAVPLFTTVRTLANLWTTVTNVLTTPLLPEVVRYGARREIDKLIATCDGYWVFVGSIVNFGVVLSYPLISILYHFWTSNLIAFDSALLCLLLAGVLVANAAGLITVYLNGMNRLHIVVGASMLRLVCGLGGGAIGYGALGLLSFGIGILVGEILIFLMMLRYVLVYELNASGAKLLARAMGPMTLSLLFSLGFLAVEGGWNPDGTAHWLIALIGIAIAFRWGWTNLDAAVTDRMMGLVKKLGRLSGIG